MDPCLPGTGATGHLLRGALEATDPLLETFDLRLLLAALPEALGSPLFVLLEVVRVVAPERLDATTFDGKHGRDRLIEQWQIV